MVVIFSHSIIRVSNTVWLGGGCPFVVTLGIFMFVKIVSYFDSRRSYVVKVLLCVLRYILCVLMM